jgi:hypothetical protein
MTLFDEADVHPGDLPEPGFYRSEIRSARFRRSSNGHRMLQVVHGIVEIPPDHDRVADYFVLEGRPYAVTTSKRRLVELYRACGLDPKPGDEITPADLLGRALDVRLAHDEWNGQPRLRVVGHRPVTRGDGDDIPF